MFIETDTTEGTGASGLKHFEGVQVELECHLIAAENTIFL
jgi:hypothetical protein